MPNFKENANLIWKVADLLRGDYRQSDYGKVILPMTVLRRLDCVLTPTKDKVLEYLKRSICLLIMPRILLSIKLPVSIFTTVVNMI